MKTRLFIAQTPHDILSAGAVASTLEKGENILFVFGENSPISVSTQSKNYIEALFATTKVFEWSSVIFVKEFGINSLNTESFRNKVKKISEKVSFIKSIVKSKVSQNANSNDKNIVQEIYANCFHHFQVRLICSCFPSSKVNYYPHGFGCLTKTEIYFYQNYCVKENLSQFLKDSFKHVLFGSNYVVPNYISIDTAYSFILSAPWAKNNISVSSFLCREKADDLFSKFPNDTKHYYKKLADRCNKKTGLLLMLAEVNSPNYSLEQEYICYRELIDNIRLKYCIDTLVIKPHPLNSMQHQDKVVAEIEKYAEGIKTIVIQEHAFYPIEIVASPFDFVVCGGVGTSSFKGLKSIYSIPMLCPEESQLELYSYSPEIYESTKVWIEENRNNCIFI